MNLITLLMSFYVVMSLFSGNVAATLETAGDIAPDTIHLYDGMPDSELKSRILKYAHKQLTQYFESLPFIQKPFKTGDNPFFIDEAIASVQSDLFTKSLPFTDEYVYKNVIMMNKSVTVPGYFGQVSDIEKYLHQKIDSNFNYGNFWSGGRTQEDFVIKNVETYLAKYYGLVPTTSEEAQTILNKLRKEKFAYFVKLYARDFRSDYDVFADRLTGSSMVTLLRENSVDEIDLTAVDSCVEKLARQALNISTQPIICAVVTVVTFYIGREIIGDIIIRRNFYLAAIRLLAAAISSAIIMIVSFLALVVIVNLGWTSSSNSLALLSFSINSGIISSKYALASLALGVSTLVFSWIKSANTGSPTYINIKPNG